MNPPTPGSFPMRGHQMSPQEDRVWEPVSTAGGGLGAKSTTKSQPGSAGLEGQPRNRHQQTPALPSDLQSHQLSDFLAGMSVVLPMEMTRIRGAQHSNPSTDQNSGRVQTQTEPQATSGRGLQPGPAELPGGAEGPGISGLLCLGWWGQSQPANSGPQVGGGLAS